MPASSYPVRRFLWLLVVGLPGIGAVAAAEPPPYVLLRESGQRVEGERLGDWHATASIPKLDGEPLFSGDPILWLRNRRLIPRHDEPESFVEFFGGDCLPGRVRAFRGGDENVQRPLPPHLMVTPSAALLPPEAAGNSPLRVLLPWARRIVWQSPARDFEPATIFFRDGRKLPFRAIRFGAEHIDVLTRSGRERIRFDQMAELHLAERDGWTTYLDELAVLSPTAQTDLLQLETVDGLRLTSCRDRFRGDARGVVSNPAAWVHGLQPAWSLDPLWVNHRDVWIYRRFPAHHVPLSRLAASGPGREAIPGRPAADTPGALLPPHRDRNVLGGLLRSDGREYGWGIGVLAASQLDFALPAEAMAVRTSIGLDTRAGEGGCARPRVLWQPQSAPPESSPSSPRTLYDGPLLIGSRQVVSTGKLSLPSPPGRLTLQVEMAHTDRPSGADPLNIRDFANWLEPIVELDRGRLADRVRPRIATRFAAWNGWNARLPTEGFRVVESWESDSESESDSDSGGRFLPVLETTGEPLVLEKRWKPADSDQWLVIGAFQSATRLDARADAEVLLSVKINGQQVVQRAASRSRGDAPRDAALVVRLPEHRQQASGGEVVVEIVQHPAAEGLGLQWRYVTISAERPESAAESDG